MRMKILDRYILSEHVAPFFGGLGVIVFIILLSHLLKILNRIIEKKIPISFVLELLAYNMAWIVTLAVPMACLIATLIAFGRLSQDLEITAMKASGYSLMRAMLPILEFGLLLSVCMGYFNDRILPEANFQAGGMAADIRRKKPLAVISERVFIDDIPGINLYVEGVNYEDNTLSGVYIYQNPESEGGEGRDRMVITAPEGRIDYDSTRDAVVLTLFNGEFNSVDIRNPKDYTRGKFKKQIIRISDLGTKLEQRGKSGRSDKDVTLTELLERLDRNRANFEDSRMRINKIVDERIKEVYDPSKVTMRKYGKFTPEESAFFAESRVQKNIEQELYLQNSLDRLKVKMVIEVHKRFSLALACLLFVFVGAPVGVMTRRGGMGTAIGFGMFFFFVFWVMLIGGEQLATRGYINPVLLFGVPILFFFFWGFIFFMVQYMMSAIHLVSL
jgi:lipopolysaccharide export system permease protein